MMNIGVIVAGGTGERFGDHKQTMVLNNKPVFTSYYTDDEGQRAKFFEIVKKFDGEVKNEPGLTIDVHMAWVSQDGKYISEYLVTTDLLINTMKKANCMLVETDSFGNLYNINNTLYNRYSIIFYKV